MNLVRFKLLKYVYSSYYMVANIFSKGKTFI